jgi:hypothetical protein
MTKAVELTLDIYGETVTSLAKLPPVIITLLGAAE